MIFTLVTCTSSQTTDIITETYTEVENHTEPYEHDEPHLPEHCEEEVTHFELVGFEWEEVMVPFGIGIWVLIASLAKLGKLIHEIVSYI